MENKMTNKFETIIKLKELKKETYNTNNYDISILASKVLKEISLNDDTKKYFDEQIDKYNKLQKSNDYNSTKQNLNSYIAKFINYFDKLMLFSFLDFEYNEFVQICINQTKINYKNNFEQQLNSYIGNGIFCFYAMSYYDLLAKTINENDENFTKLMYKIRYESDYATLYDFYYLRIRELENDIVMNEYLECQYFLLKIAILKVLTEMIYFLEKLNEPKNIIKIINTTKEKQENNFITKNKKIDFERYTELKQFNSTQREIINLIINRRSIEEIATNLNLSKSSINNNIASISKILHQTGIKKNKKGGRKEILGFFEKNKKYYMTTKN